MWKVARSSEQQEGEEARNRKEEKRTSKNIKGELVYCMGDEADGVLHGQDLAPDMTQSKMDSTIFFYRRKT